MLSEKNQTIVLYSTDCPRCRVLEKKLTDACVPFTVSHDVSGFAACGFDTAPILDVDGRLMNFTEAVQWLKMKG